MGFEPPMQSASGGPVLEEPRAIPAPGASMRIRRSMLAHRVEVDQVQFASAPQQIGSLHVAVADVRTEECVEDGPDGFGLSWWRLAVGCQMLREVRSGTVIGDQPGTAAQRPPPLLDHGQRRRRRNAQKTQAIALHP